MREDIQRIEAKLDKVTDRLSNIDSTLAAQHVSIAEHIRRTNLLENDLKPVKRHVTMVEGVLKFLGALAMIAGLIEVIARLK